MMTSIHEPILVNCVVMCRHYQINGKLHKNQKKKINCVTSYGLEISHLIRKITKLKPARTARFTQIQNIREAKEKSASYKNKFFYILIVMFS